MFTSPIMPAMLVSALAHFALLFLLLNNAYMSLLASEDIPVVDSVKTIHVTFSTLPRIEAAAAPPKAPPPEPVTPSKSQPEPIAKATPPPKVSQIPKPPVAIKKPQRKKPKSVPTPKPAVKPEPVVEPVAEAAPPPAMPAVTPQKQEPEEAHKPTPLPALASTSPPRNSAVNSDGVLKKIIDKPGYRSKPKAPKYPRKAKRKRQQGTVRVRVLVSESGTNLEVKVYRSSGFDILDEAALQAVKDWRFKPATADGKLVMAWVEVPVEFKLR